MAQSSIQKQRVCEVTGEPAYIEEFPTPRGIVLRCSECAEPFDVEEVDH